MDKRWQKLLFWVTIALLFFGFIYLIKSILLPFVASLMIAYFLDPAADRLEERGFGRGLASLTIIIAFFLGLSLLSVLLVPMLYEQMMALVASLPDILQEARNKLTYYAKQIDPGQAFNTKAALASGGAAVAGSAGGLLEKILASGIALLNVFALIFVTPIVAFYMLRDWDIMVAKIDAVLPRDNAEVIRERMREIDHMLAGWIRGQTTVCLLLGLFYAVGLTLVGLNNGFLIGFLTGLVSFVPYIGMLIGTIIGIAVAIQQFGEWSDVGMVAAVFAVGQFLEGNFVTPRLVGSRVNLHPVWVMFGMLAGAALFGFVGVFLAVPVTATIGVLARHAIERYRMSALYDIPVEAVPHEAVLRNAPAFEPAKKPLPSKA